MHAAIVLLILILTYLGMIAGRIAWLRVDRTGIALLAVIALLASGQMTLDDFGSAVDMPTLALLFAMMIISAQFAESGFIDLCARTITGWGGGTAGLLAITVAIGGALSAVLANDILIVTIAPLLIAGARRRGLDHRRAAPRQPQDHQPDDDRGDRLALVAARLLPVRDHRRAERCRTRGQGLRFSRRSRAVAEQPLAPGAVRDRHEQRDRQRAGGDARNADLADAAGRRPLCAGAALDLGRQSPVERQLDQFVDRRAGRTHRHAAHLPRPRPGRRADRAPLARLRDPVAPADRYPARPAAPRPGRAALGGDPPRWRSRCTA